LNDTSPHLGHPGHPGHPAASHRPGHGVAADPPGPRARGSYRAGLATGLGVVLPAGLILGIADVLRTRGPLHGDGPAAGLDPAPFLLAMWALVALPLAIAVGLVLGAGNATWGAGWVRRAFRRLRADADLDRAVAAALIAAAALGGVLALGIARLALALVAEVNRKSVGALLLGVVVVGALPLLALAALPIYRVARRITAVIPAIGPISRVVLLVAAAAAAGTLAGMYIVLRKLDYQALNLVSLGALAMLPVIALAIALLAYGPLAGLRERIPQRGVLAAAGLAVAIALPLVVLRMTPAETTRTAVTEQSYIGARMVGALRALIDRDGDGHSAFFGGPDCDDGNPAVRPGGTEVPGNGLDDNCVGGDARIEDAAPTPAPAAAGQASPSSPAALGPRGRDNVLVLFIDTLRFDRLGIAGYKRDGKSLTPRLDAFAAQSTVFRRAFAQAPNTPRSVPSILASRYPSQVKYDKRFKNYATVLDDNDLLFEVLKPAGFTTIGQSSHFYFCDRKKYPDSCDGVVDWMNSNITQGADEWDNSGALNIPESNKDTAAPRIVKKALARLGELAKARTKFAMIVHLFEPHSTYMEHEGFRYTERGTAGLAEKYDYEIAYVDARIGELLDGLDALGLAASTTVVVMADHGEAFGAHIIGGKPAFFHGDSLYRELIHVPLMFRIPGAAPCERDDIVELIDLPPTIAALFGVAPAPSWRGRSLLPALACQPLPPRPAFAELMAAPSWNHEAKAMVTADGKHHVYYRVSDSRWEIYDLENDPDEKVNRAGAPNAADLKRAMVEWIEGPLAAGGGK
jgi:arylsulfatase A-like enzyme